MAEERKKMKNACEESQKIMHEKRENDTLFNFESFFSMSETVQTSENICVPIAFFIL